MSKLLLEKYKDIKNEKLNKILEKIELEPIFLNQKRLLSESEVIDYKNELKINDDNIIVLVDCFDNEFLIFDISDNNFKMYSIDDNFIYNSKSIALILKELIENEI